MNYTKTGLLLVAFFCHISLSFAQDNDSLRYERWKKYTIEAGSYIANVDSRFRFNTANSGVGLEINAEEALGLDTRTFTARGSFLYRFSEDNKKALYFSIFQINRRSKKILNEDTELNNEDYQSGTTVNTKFNLNVSKLEYRYSIIQDERVDLSLSAGMYIMPMNISLQKDTITAQNAKFVAPLPMIGTANSFYLNDKFVLNYSMSLFYLKVGDFKGSMLDAMASLEYHPYEKVAFGVGFNSFNIDFSAQNQDLIFKLKFDGDVSYKHSGALFYLKADF